MDIKKYNTKARTVEAVEVTGNIKEIALWCGEDAYAFNGKIFLKPSEKTMNDDQIHIQVNEGDFIVKTEDGEFEIENAEEFDRKYAVAE